MISALLLALALAGPARADAQSDFDAGTTALRAGDAGAAASSLLAAVEEGGKHAAVYHALGNALYRQQQRGLAIVAWRRGLVLEPRNGDLAANLDRARRETLDRLDPPTTAFGPFFWASTLSAREGALLASAGWTVALLLLAIGRVGRAAPRLAGLAERAKGLRGLAFSAAGGALLLTASTVLVARQPPSLVVTVPVVSARSALGPDGVELFVLHEGAEVRLLESSGDADLVALPDERKGWVPRDALVTTDPAAPFPTPATPASVL